MADKEAKLPRADKKTAREEAKRQKEMEKDAAKARKEAERAARKTADVAGEAKWTGESGIAASSGAGPAAAAVLPDAPKASEALLAALARDKRLKLLLDAGIVAGLLLLIGVLAMAAGVVLADIGVQTLALAVTTAVLASS